MLADHEIIGRWGGGLAYLVDGRQLTVAITARDKPNREPPPSFTITLCPKKIRQWRIEKGYLCVPADRDLKPENISPPAAAPEPPHDPLIFRLTGLRVPIGTHRAFTFETL